MSIINYKSSQSEIYLTAKTVGDPEEDTGARLKVDGWIFVGLLLEYKSVTTGTAGGNLESVSTRYRSPSREDAAGLTRTYTTSPLWPARRGKRLWSAIYF